MSAFRNSFRPFKSSSAFRLDNEPVVQNGLAVTPAMSLELTQQGLSISSMNSINSHKFAADNEKDWSVPIEFQRGVDVLADGYQQQQTSRDKLREFITKKQQDIVAESES